MQADKKIKLNLDTNTIYFIPTEILLKIFCHLNGEDVKNIRLVCKHWYNITQFPEIGTKLKLKLVQIVSNSILERFNFLQSSSQKFYEIKLKRCNVDLLTPFFQIIGKHVRILKIEDCYFVSDSVLENILNSTKFIEELRIVYCSFDQCTIPQYTDALKNIKLLEILNKPTTKTKYLEVINIIDNIEENKLISFSLNYVYKVCRESNGTNVVHLVEMIQRNNDSLKELNLLDCCFVEKNINDKFWDSLNKRKSKLDKLSISYMIPNPIYKKFIQFLILQKNLNNLSLSHVPSLNDDVMQKIIENLLYLKQIDLTNCVNLTDKSILILLKLQHLEALNIDYNSDYVAVHKINISSIINGIGEKQNHNLKTLSLCNIKMEVEELYDLINKLPNLRKLKIHSINMMIQDENLRIFKILSNCKLLEDLSFVNYKKTKNQTPICFIESNSSNRNLKTLEMSYSESCREFLDAMKLPNLKTLKIYYHDDTRQRDSGKQFIKALFDSAKSIENIKLTVISDIDTILDLILTGFKKLKSLSFVWHCENCFLFKRINIQTNQQLHSILRKSLPDSFQFDESCNRCKRLFSILREY